MTKEEVDISKFKIDANKPQLADQEADVEYFTIGAAKCKADHPFILARKTNDGLGERYWIQCVSEGSFSGRFFNPNTTFMDQLVKRYELREVQARQFNLYLTFLETRKSAFLTQAERI